MFISEMFILTVIKVWFSKKRLRKEMLSIATIKKVYFLVYRINF